MFLHEAKQILRKVFSELSQNKRTIQVCFVLKTKLYKEIHKIIKFYYFEAND